VQSRTFPKMVKSNDLGLKWSTQEGVDSSSLSGGGELENVHKCVDLSRPQGCEPSRGEKPGRWFFW
jgi:hypothetical protein